MSPTCSGGPDAGDQMPVPAHDPLGVGLAVFSSSAQVLYLDRPARRLLKLINLTEKGYATDGALPRILTELYDELLRVVRDRTRAHCWTCVVVKRVIPMQGLRMLIRAVGCQTARELSGYGSCSQCKRSIPARRSRKHIGLDECQ